MVDEAKGNERIGPPTFSFFHSHSAGWRWIGTGVIWRWLPLHDDCLLYGTLRCFSLSLTFFPRQSPRESQTTNEFKKNPVSILLDINVLVLTWEAFLFFFPFVCLSWSFHRVQPSSDSLPVRPNSREKKWITINTIHHLLVVKTCSFLSPLLLLNLDNCSVGWEASSSIVSVGIAADPGYPAVPSLKSLNSNVRDDTGDKRRQKWTNLPSTFSPSSTGDALENKTGSHALKTTIAFSHRPIRLAYMSHSQKV